MTASSSTPEQVQNGVNVDALLGAREALEKAPEAAQFKWRASCEWLNGTHSRSTIGKFFGLGAEQSRDKTFTVEADHPKVFASEDHARRRSNWFCPAGELFDRGRCRDRPAARHPAHSVKASLEADMDIQAFSVSTMTCATVSAPSASTSTSVPTPARTTSRRWSRNRRSGPLFDIITNPTAVFVTVN
jgi:hypothetical protein